MNMLGFLLDRSAMLVKRWASPPAKIQQENDAEHHAQTSRIAYSLAWLVRHHGIRHRGVDPAAIAVAAGVHDEPEIMTSDLPATLKNLFSDVRRTTTRWERRALPFLFEGAPAPLAEHLREVVVHANDYSKFTGQIVRYADDPSALAFAEAEVRLGNTDMPTTRDNILAVAGSREWTWLRKLRRFYPELP